MTSSPEAGYGAKTRANEINLVDSRGVGVGGRGGGEGARERGTKEKEEAIFWPFQGSDAMAVKFCRRRRRRRAAAVRVHGLINSVQKFEGQTSPMPRLAGWLTCVARYPESRCQRGSNWVSPEKGAREGVMGTASNTSSPRPLSGDRLDSQGMVRPRPIG